jgi:hypothetical protein
MPLSGSALPFSAPPTDSGPSIEESLQEAQARPLDFPATERAVYIRAMVRRAQELKASGRSVQEIRQQLPEFYRDYPHLFDTILENEFDTASLQTMLAMLERMGQGSLNHHQATVIVGQRLAKKYIHSADSEAGQK